MGKKKTHDEYVAEVFEINPNIEVVGIYINAKLPITHRCNIDDYEWDASPDHILRGRGCPKCANNIKKIHDAFALELSIINDNIEVIGKYINNKTKILCKCKLDGFEWYAYPDNLLHGHGCPKCSVLKAQNDKTKTHNDYVQALEKINPNILVLDEYIRNDVPILHKCKIDNYEWMTIPSNILRGAQCPRCVNREKYTTDSFKEKMSKINNNIIILGEYVHSKIKILCKCKIDGYEWKATPTNLIYGRGCPMCNESHGEKAISLYLTDNKIDFIPQYTFLDCKRIKLLPFDFYLKDYNACIEYDGEQHFRPIDYFGGKNGFEQRKINDSIKTRYCNDNNIPLLRIRYDQDIISSINGFLNELTVQN